MSIEKIKSVSEQILNRLPAVKGKGEEATKQALILPMLDALGYDIWDPSEVCPEFDADFAVKKLGQKEKVDVAILIGGVPRIYIEVKQIETALDGHEGQLARYFNATQSVTLAALTNGIEWRFFTDTGDPNVMDNQPFHVAKFDSADQGIDVMARFSKSVFSAEAIRDYATELRYTAQIASFLRNEIDLKEREPSEQFIRWILKSDKMYEGVVNGNVLERFKPIVKAGLTRVVREVVRRSIAAMDVEAAQPNKPTNAISNSSQIEEILDSASESEFSENQETQKSAIVTTENELKIFAIIKEQFEKSALFNKTIFDASARKEVPISIGYKDTTGYFGIYFNKPSWWILRVVIESKKPWVGFNIGADVASSLVPSTLTKLEPNPYSEFRVSLNNAEDFHQLNRLIFAAFEKTISDRARTVINVNAGSELNSEALIENKNL